MRDGAFLCAQVVGLSPLLHPRPHRLPPGLSGAGQALPLPPHHVSILWPGSAVPELPRAAEPDPAVCSPLFPQDAVLRAFDAHPQLGFHGCGHGSSGGEWDWEGRGGTSCAGTAEGTHAILPSLNDVPLILTGHQRLLRGPR